jgi:glycosyltransferase involved in cell wall biosynthesis
MDRMNKQRIALQQRVLAAYRAPFFDALGKACDGELAVFAGLPRPEESIATANTLQDAQFTLGRNIHILRGALYFYFQRGLGDWIKHWDPHALIVEANPRNLSTPAAIRWMKQRQRPAIGWGLGAAHITGALGSLWVSQRAAFLKQFDALVTYSQRGADEYTALGYPAENIFIAPNAAARRPEGPAPKRPAVFNGKPSLLFVGRLQRRKRVDLLLQACACLPPGIQPRLVIAGDGPERSVLETLAARIYPAAEFTGALHGPQLAPYFLSADLFVLPGTGGLAVQEAMAWGLPVVMGEGDGTNDDLVRPGNGWQLSNLHAGDSQTPEALAGILGEALSDVARLRRMGEESYRIVTDEINLEKMVAVFMDALERVAPINTRK